MKGDVSVGDSYTLSIGEQSSNYDTIVPTSAIREDSNGKFILIIESKSTPLGNRYYARRVDVDVITSDDTKSAVTGALEGYEYVITTTTKPIKENEQVRLASEIKQKGMTHEGKAVQKILLLVLMICAAILFGCVERALGRQLSTQQIASEWSAEDSYAQISCFFSKDAAVTKDYVIQLEQKLKTALQEAQRIHRM